MSDSMRSTDNSAQPLLLGWREWLSLPDLGLAWLKAKVDTGARTSTLHAFGIESFERHGQPYVRFGIHPLQQRVDLVVYGEAPVVDRRRVCNSGGHREERYIILTRLALAGHVWPIELTLTDRESMQFRMLLGRTALTGRALIDPARSFVMGRVLEPWRPYLPLLPPHEPHAPTK